MHKEGTVSFGQASVGNSQTSTPQRTIDDRPVRYAMQDAVDSCSGRLSNDNTSQFQAPAFDDRSSYYEAAENNYIVFFNVQVSSSQGGGYQARNRALATCKVSANNNKVNYYKVHLLDPGNRKYFSS